MDKQPKRYEFAPTDHGADKRSRKRQVNRSLRDLAFDYLDDQVTVEDDWFDALEGFEPIRRRNQWTQE